MPKRFAKLLRFLKPKRQWAQFSMGTLLLAVTVLCVWLADYVSPIRRLQRQLRDPDAEVRASAAERLGYLGPEARSATNSLLHATADGSSLVRLKAVWALSRVSGRADLLVPLLANDDDTEVCLAAAEGLLWIGHDPRKVVPALLEMYAGPVYSKGFAEWECDSIFEALSPGQSALVVPLLVDSLWSAEEVERRDEGNPAASALRNVAVPAPTVVPDLVDRLISTRPEVRTAAAEQLLRLGKAAQEALPALRSGMHDSNAACAAACAAAVGAIDPDDADFFRVLTESLTADDFELSQHVAAYLFMLGPATAEADDLAAFLCDRDPTLLWAGDGNILRRLGPAAVSALDRKLKDALADRDRAPAAAGEIVLSLGFIGPPAAPAVPTLIAALDSADAQFNAVHALGSIGKRAASAVPRLLPLLDPKQPQLSYATCMALEKIGGDDEAARARLRPLQRSSDWSVRVQAALALAAFAEPVDQILPALTELASDPKIRSRGKGVPLGGSYSPGAREELVGSIASLGPAAVARLTLALDDANPNVRRVAAESLGKIGPAAKDAVPRLIELLDDEPTWEAAAMGLGGIGQPARAAVAKLLDELVAMRQPPKPGDYDPNEHHPNDYDWSGDDTSQYLPRLDALAGIGQDAHEAASEVLRLTNSSDVEISRAALLTLARIDPANPSLIPRMRRRLAEWERESVINGGNNVWRRDDSLRRFIDTVWDLGSHAQPLVPDLERVLTADHLVNRQVRCYAAFALARFDSHREMAVAYLERVISSSFPESFDSVNLAYRLLGRINGEEEATWLMMPLGVGP